MSSQSSQFGSPLLQPRIPETLPLSSGTSATNTQINNTNLEIQTIIAQSKANTMYDPIPPAPTPNSNKIEGFITEKSALSLVAVGLIFLGMAFLSGCHSIKKYN